MNARKFFKEITPPFIIKMVKSIARTKPATDGSELYCPVCQQSVGYFARLPIYYDDEMMKYGFVHSIFQYETMNRINYTCPNCYASDRDRLYSLFIREKYAKMRETGLKYNLLDIAPANSLATHTLKQDFINYRSVDKYMDGVDDRADITDMNIYSDEMFNIIICSHVLEHIPDDRKAISEIYRILKKGGWAIIMVPILLTLDEDLENPDYNTEELRWKYYGQGDHVRQYSKSGFIKKLRDGGFRVNQLGADYFGKDVFQKNGIHERSILYVVEK